MQFPNGYTVKEGSPYQDDLKVTKIPVKKEKVEGETMKLKMKDLIHEALKELGNPVSFNNTLTIKQFVTSEGLPDL